MHDIGLHGIPATILDKAGALSASESERNTCVFTQSFAQARARWGRDAAWALFGSATLALILGGLKEDDALESLSRIVGERTVRTRSQSRGHSGASHGWSERSERVLPVAKIRQLRADKGQALLLYRHLESVVRLQAVWERRDAAAIESAREQVQAPAPRRRSPTARRARDRRPQRHRRDHDDLCPHVAGREADGHAAPRREAPVIPVAVSVAVNTPG